MLGDLSGFFEPLGGGDGGLLTAGPNAPRSGGGCSFPAMPLSPEMAERASWGAAARPTPGATESLERPIPEMEAPGSEGSPLAASSRYYGGGVVGGSGPPSAASGCESMDLCLMPNNFAKLLRSMTSPRSEDGAAGQPIGGCELQL